MNNTVRLYTHLPLNEPIEFVSASYWIAQEDKIPYKDKEVLCIVRETSPITCCGGGCSCGFMSILIPGFIKRFKYKKGDDGLFISDIEPVEDENVMEEIKQIVQEKYNFPQVEFFCP